MAEKILIYGGSGGIGSATGRLLREQGVALHLVGRNAELLAAVAAELQTTYTVGDVTDNILSQAANENASSDPG